VKRRPIHWDVLSTSQSRTDDDHIGFAITPSPHTLELSDTVLSLLSHCFNQGYAMRLDISDDDGGLAFLHSFFLPPLALSNANAIPPSFFSACRSFGERSGSASCRVPGVTGGSVLFDSVAAAGRKKTRSLKARERQNTQPFQRRLSLR